MSRKDFVVSTSPVPSSPLVKEGHFDKMNELSNAVSQGPSSPSISEDPDGGIDKMIKDLLFMGRLEKEVKIQHFSFKINTLTEERQRILVSRVMRMTDEEKVAFAKVYTVSESVSHVNDVPIEDISRKMFPNEDNVEIAVINFFGRLQASIIDILFEEYETLLNKSREEIGYEQVKK